MSSRICSTTDSMRKRKRKGEKERKGKKKKEKGGKKGKKKRRRKKKEEKYNDTHASFSSARKEMDLNKESNVMKSLSTSSYLGSTSFFMYQGNQISRHPDKILGIL